jgi:hypothetical protein
MIRGTTGKTFLKGVRLGVGDPRLLEVTVITQVGNDRSPTRRMVTGMES